MKVKLILSFLISSIILSTGFSQTYTITNYSTKEGLAHDETVCMMQDSRGFIWTGTYSGVSIFDGISFKTLTKADGLIDNIVTYLFEDSKGNIWIGTQNGMLTYILKSQAT